MRGLFWFREDLRLHDNPALSHLAEQCDELILLYCFDDRLLHSGNFQSKGIGAPRMSFLTESLNQLSKTVESLGQRLIIRRGDPTEIVSQLVRRYSIDCLGLTRMPAPSERQTLETLKTRFPRLSITDAWGHTLFSPKQLPFLPENLPSIFSRFRALVQHLEPEAPENAPDTLPPLPLISRTEECDPLPVIRNPYSHEWVPPHWFGFCGGETAGLRQLNYYLWDRHMIRRYE